LRRSDAAIGYRAPVITVAALHVYPVKSCRGIALEEARLTEAGLEHDREWMIVTPDGRFVTQRERPRLALIETRLTADALVLSAPGLEPLVVPFDHAGAPVEVTVWRDRCRAHDQGEDAARWLRAFAGHELRLVRFDPSHRRPSDGTWTGGLEAFARFSDGFALLAISSASLADLNARLATPLPMNRFRPNVVLGGLPPYGEDQLDDLLAGGVRLRRAKPCARCIITTTDQASGDRDGEEPLRTLKTYRWDPALKGVMFGQNMIVVAGAGSWLRAGMELRAARSG
jgi:uncharacterized protein YcbX